MAIHDNRTVALQLTAQNLTMPSLNMHNVVGNKNKISNVKNVSEKASVQIHLFSPVNNKSAVPFVPDTAPAPKAARPSLPPPHHFCLAVWIAITEMLYSAYA